MPQCPRLNNLTGNPQEVLKAIADRHKMEPVGEPSLQNAVEMARGSMRYKPHEPCCRMISLLISFSHLPTHSSRELLIIFGSLTTCDPGNIHETIDACVKSRARISVVALAAEMKICREMCEKTGGNYISICLSMHVAHILTNSRSTRPIWRCHERRPL